MSAEIRIRLPKLDELWRRGWQIYPLLRKATRYSNGAYEPEDVLCDVILGKSFLWIVEDESEDLVGVVVASVAQFPRRRTIQAPFVAGTRLAEWWPLIIEELDKFAKAKGATAIYTYGRRGWVRFWQSRGIAVRVSSEMLIREL